MLGEPYRVAGRTYVPRDNPSYSAVGLASWYGPEFHGRKTANGEVYDMKELTAAHPTLPLPCYARVTNLVERPARSSSASMTAGPFSRSRIIDVSSTVADILDFKRAGTARVQVDYVGLAQMDGRDRNDLLATYRGPGVKTANTLVAENSTPLSMRAPTPVRRRFRHARRAVGPRSPASLTTTIRSGRSSCKPAYLVLPADGPLLPRPRSRGDHGRPARPSPDARRTASRTSGGRHRPDRDIRRSRRMRNGSPRNSCASAA